MRATSWSAWSILLITLSIFSTLVFAGGYEEPFHIAYDHRSQLMQDGTFPNILKKVLRGQHHLPVAPFPDAEVLVTHDLLQHYAKFHSVANHLVIRYLRRFGDVRRFIILGAPNPRDASQKGYSVAFRLGDHPQYPNEHVFAFVSVEHVPGQVPKVHIRGIARASNLPGLQERLFTRDLPPNHSPVFDIGHIVTTRELFAKLHQGMVGTPPPPPTVG